MNFLLFAQNDDPELLEWLAKAAQDGGGFVGAVARAGLVADCDNYPLIRPLLMQLRRKYPAYEPSDQVKQEIRGRKEPAWNAVQFVADMPLGPGDARANLLCALLLIAYLADRVYTAELANGARVLDASDFSAFCREVVEVIRKVARLADAPDPTLQLRAAPNQLPPPAQRRYDPTCNRCGHVHEGVGECGMFMGNGRFCRCELELSA